MVRGKRAAGALLLSAALVLSGSCATAPDMTDLKDARELAGPESRYVDIDGISIRYTAAGEHLPGTPLVLLHGFLSNLHSWDYVIEELSEHRPVYAYDRIAFGLSERPLPPEYTWKTSPYSAEAVRSRLIGFLDAMGIEKAVLVGNSAGGTLALEAALAAPERVSALVLIDPAVYASGPPPYVKFLLRLPGARFFGLRTIRRLAGEDPAQLLAQAWYNPEAVPEELAARYALPLQAHNWDRALWEFTRAPGAPPLDDRLTITAVPVLILHGEADTIIPVEQSIRLAEQLPDAELHIIPRCGHVPQEECPEVTLAHILRFLD
jgi:pimeloyl-ACP methyl ester carboxylesterase